MTTTVIALLIILSFLYLGLMTGKVMLALSYAASDVVGESGIEERSVAVLQAVLSGDHALREILESNLTSLPGQHFIWLCDEDDADGIRITDELIGLHPECMISRPLCPPCPPDKNPKLFKLIIGARIATAPCILVLDDDTHLPSESAAALIARASTHDIATGLPQYAEGTGFPSSLLAQFVNNNSAMTYLSLLPMTSPISINGMCYAIRREHSGCFEAISNHLTDDLALASLIRRNNGTIHQSSHSQRIATTVNGFGHYISLMHRWNLFVLILLKDQGLFYRLVIVLLHGWHPIALWIIILAAAFHPSTGALAVVATTLLVRSMLLLLMQKKLFHRNAHRPLVSLLSELLQPFHLAHALVDRKIKWRNRRYRVHASDRFDCCE